MSGRGLRFTEESVRRALEIKFAVAPLSNKALNFLVVSPITSSISSVKGGVFAYEVSLDKELRSGEECQRGFLLVAAQGSLSSNCGDVTGHSSFLTSWGN